MLDQTSIYLYDNSEGDELCSRFSIRFIGSRRDSHGFSILALDENAGENDHAKNGGTSFNTCIWNLTRQKWRYEDPTRRNCHPKLVRQHGYPPHCNCVLPMWRMEVKNPIPSLLRTDGKPSPPTLQTMVNSLPQ